MQVDFFHVYPGISATALLISGGVYALVYAVLGWVFYKRRHIEPLANRSLPILLLQLGAMTVGYFCYSLSIYFLYDAPNGDVSCQLQYWLYSLLNSVYYHTLTIRGNRLYLQYTRGKLMVADDRASKGLPADFEHVELHRRMVKLLNWSMTSWGTFALIFGVQLVTFFVLIAMYYTVMEPSPLDPTWCNKPAYAFFIVVQLLSNLLIGIPNVILTQLAKANDQYSIRQEFSTLMSSTGPLNVVSVVALFAIPVAYGVFLLAASWLNLTFSFLVPIIQSYIHEQNLSVFLLRGKEKKKADAFKSNRFLQCLPRSLRPYFLSGSDVVNVTIDTSDSSDKGKNLTGESHELNSSVSGTGATGHEQTIGANDVFEPTTTVKTAKYNVFTWRKAKSGNAVHLKDLLMDSIERERLLELAVQCFSAELVLFSVDVLNFHDLISSDAKPLDEQILAAAHIIDLYIAAGGAREININDDTRQTILSKFSALKTQHTDGKLTAEDKTLKSIFDVAEMEIKLLLRTNILPLWRPSAASVAMASETSHV